MATKRKAASKASGTRRKRRGVKIEAVALAAPELARVELSGETAELAEQVARDGGVVLAPYRDPLGGHTLLMVALPTACVTATPFQRDASDAHVRKLTRAMDKTKRFLDPIILVRHGDQYYTPNGNHRLTAMKELGAQAIVGLLVPEYEVAYQILALNIEKAHNLRERALEVVRMYRDLLRGPRAEQKESAYELEFEEPALITLGFAYEQRGRISGGAYHPALRKVDAFAEQPLSRAVEERERRAALVIDLDDAVNDVIVRLKARGLTSPYLRSFVVARVNPLRFIKGDPPSFDELLATMTKRARGFKVEKIVVEDVARTGGAAPDED
jgi:ParB family transcriptional regulator, chromosome partitioning protein